MAGRLTGAGLKVAVIERLHFGGTCVNTGCKPTKTLVASAYAARMAQRAAEYGVVLNGAPGIDMATVQARAEKVIQDSRSSVEGWLGGMEGCTLFRGHARFTGPHAIEVDGEALSAERIFINVGGRAAVPDMPGIDEVPYLTNSDMVEMKTVPEHLVVVGGSYIGLEFAQMFRRFGAEVDGHREGAAADRAGGRGRLGHDPRDIGGRRHPSPYLAPNASASPGTSAAWR